MGGGVVVQRGRTSMTERERAVLHWNMALGPAAHKPGDLHQSYRPRLGVLFTCGEEGSLATVAVMISWVKAMTCAPGFPSAAPLPVVQNISNLRDQNLDHLDGLHGVVPGETVLWNQTELAPNLFTSQGSAGHTPAYTWAH